jgi:hypothetical protein
VRYLCPCNDDNGYGPRCHMGIDIFSFQVDAKEDTWA